MSNPSGAAPVSSLSSAASAPASQIPVSAAQVMALVFESTQLSGDPLQALDLSKLAPAEWKRLEQSLAAHQDKLTEQEKSALQNNRHAEVVVALKRLRTQEAQKHARVQAQEAHQTTRGADGALAEHPVAPAVVEHQERLPANSEQPQKSHPARPPAVLWPQHQGTLLTKGQPLQVAARLLGIKQALLKLVTAPGDASKADKAQSLLGNTGPKVTYFNAFPAQGRSGELHRLPLLQFAPPRLRAALEAVGINTLADFLVGCLASPGRQLLAEACGVPRPALLLAAHRAELLDLPLERNRFRPHIKDILLLAKLGIRTTHNLALLGKLADENPTQLDILAKLIAALQRADANTVGRQRWTRHELRDWGKAAERRLTDITLPAHTGGLEDHADLVLQQGLNSKMADAQDAFAQAVLHLCAQLAALGAWTAELERLLKTEADAQLFERARALIAQGHGGTSSAREMLSAYEDYSLHENELSLFADLAPLQRPDAPRQDGMVCFWMDPAPQLRAALDGLAQDAVPAAMQPIYMCLDPTSGALVVP